jgi:hypothetical protein
MNASNNNNTEKEEEEEEEDNDSIDNPNNSTNNLQTMAATFSTWHLLPSQRLGVRDHANNEQQQ